jgi:hypothetical protein
MYVFSNGAPIGWRDWLTGNYYWPAGAQCFVVPTRKQETLCWREPEAIYQSTLGPTVRRPVSLGIKPPLGLKTRLLLVRHLRFCQCGVPSLTRGRVCRFEEFLHCRWRVGQLLTSDGSMLSSLPDNWWRVGQCFRATARCYRVSHTTGDVLASCFRATARCYRVFPTYLIVFK